MNCHLLNTVKSNEAHSAFNSHAMNATRVINVAATRRTFKTPGIPLRSKVRHVRRKKVNKVNKVNPPISRQGGCNLIYLSLNTLTLHIKAASPTGT